MDNQYRGYENNPENNNNMINYEDQDVYSNRYRNYDYDRRYYGRYNRRYDDRYDRMRYYRYPYCDRYGRCDNQLWWLFWPFFFL